MIRYILKRLLHMIPILFGVILITFMLFQVVGGSPANMVLGQHATATSLEEYEVERGFNRPAFYGKWLTTRAIQDTDFTKHPAKWKMLEAGDASAALKPGEALDVPLAFTLDSNTSTRLSFNLKLDDGEQLRIADDGKEVVTWSGPATGWQHAELTSGQWTMEAIGGDVDFLGAKLRLSNPNPLNSRFMSYLKRLVRFDLGTSTETNRPVVEMLRDGALPSLALTIPIFLGSILIGVALSLVCAYKRDQLTDRLVVFLATVLMSINYIVWIIAGQYYFSFKWHLFPIWGFESFHYLLLPVAIGIFTAVGKDVRFYRTVMLDEMYNDYVRTARAKGVPVRRILFRHVLRNALVPILTNASMSLPFLFTGSLLLEKYFGIPGLGGLSINAIHANDLDVVQAVVLIGAVLYVFVNLITDLSYAWVDPRVRLQGGKS